MTGDLLGYISNNNASPTVSECTQKSGMFAGGEFMIYEKEVCRSSLVLKYPACARRFWFCFPPVECAHLRCFGVNMRQFASKAHASRVAVYLRKPWQQDAKGPS